MTYAVDYALTDGDAPPGFEAAKEYAGGSLLVGIRGAWGYDGQEFTDTTLARDAAVADAAGCPVFGYVFLDYATDIAKTIAAISYVREPGDLPFALDLEMDTPPPGTTPASRLAAAEYAAQLLMAKFGPHGVWVYTSFEQWQDHFGGLDSEILGGLPLWLKVPYPWNARNPPHLESVPGLGEIPTPWKRAGSPGVWMEQFQGDAIGFPGFTSTVDISKFLTVTSPADPRWVWINEVCGGNFPKWQSANELTPDNIPGPASFAVLTEAP